MGKPLRTLTMARDQSDLAAALGFLHSAFLLQHRHVSDLRGFETEMEGGRWGLVIAVDDPAFEPGRITRAVLGHPDVPALIVLADPAHPDRSGSEWMAQGAHDFIPHEHLWRLVPAVRRELAAAETRLARRLTESHARELAGQVKAFDERWRLLGESSPDYIVVLNREGRIEFLNRDEAVGPSPVGQLAANYAAGNNRERLDAALAEAWQTDGLVTFELESETREGQPIWLSNRARRFVDIDGTPKLLIYSTDVTEQRRLENELRHSQRMEAIGRLTAGIAHDFNNLLTVVISYSGLVRNEFPEGHTAREDVDAIAQAAQRGAELTNKLLAFGRRSIQRPEPIDLRELVLEADRFLPRMLGPDISLTVTTGDRALPVRADRQQVDQILLNLVLNAKDAMPSGGSVAIGVEALEVTVDGERPYPLPPGRYVALSVSDTGAGIDPKIRERIFEPFFTTKGRGQGSGLGLSTVYGIVKQSKGHIDVESEPGTGTTIRVFLPVLDAAEAAQTPRQRKVTSSGEMRGVETVLVVDDNPPLRRAACRILQNADYRVLSADSGSDALGVAAAHQGPIDLLLTDVVMPEMTGQELAETLRDHRPGVRVLYMSGYTENEFTSSGELRSDIRLVEKPFTAGELLTVVRETLEEEAATDPT